MDILYSQKAEKQLRKIYKSDRQSAVRIIKTIESYAANRQEGMTLNRSKGKWRCSSACASAIIESFLMKTAELAYLSN